MVGWDVGGGEGGNGLASEKRRGAGSVCSASEGGRWVVESVDGGEGGERNGRLRGAEGMLRGRGRAWVPWAFTGLFWGGARV